MTTTTIAYGAPTSAPGVRRAGILCLGAGILGAASGIFLAVVPTDVPADRYSYPLSATAFVVIQAWFAVQHLGLLAGIIGLGRSGATGGRLVGVRSAAAGMALLTATEIAAMAAARSSYPGPGTGVLDALYGVAVVLTAGGLIVAGLAVLRARLWRGARRWLPLATGVYALVPMTPLMLAGYLGARLAISGWMLLFAALGWALAREGSR